MTATTPASIPSAAATTMPSAAAAVSTIVARAAAGRARTGHCKHEEVKSKEEAA
jgi:hypothetical protein